MQVIFTSFRSSLQSHTLWVTLFIIKLFLYTSRRVHIYNRYSWQNGQNKWAECLREPMSISGHYRKHIFLSSLIFHMQHRALCNLQIFQLIYFGKCSWNFYKNSANYKFLVTIQIESEKKTTRNAVFFGALCTKN